MNNQIAKQYVSHCTKGRGAKCPRIGFYKILNTHKGKCYGKDAILAEANWKLMEEDKYDTDFVVEIQIESLFGPNAVWITPFKATREGFKDTEIRIVFAEYKKSKRFVIVIEELTCFVETDPVAMLLSSSVPLSSLLPVEVGQFLDDAELDFFDDHEDLEFGDQ